ncbi:DegT/DnrJ/EryC1/StrS aminotransferase family protein [Mangrovimonas sp. TPBH4]|uniref:DegT/DnrJ/EryC1/StrS family aminotransferase n=1 Tax=Mangrovimonas sp. TPBH4 TaxID=1645914 RepID=UPI0006B41A81|nr:aminotransferase class I/II-fold pyridoxal phosphate-dependent enzyme [Mangrovimonas sp. TPBH4]
MNSKIWLSSPHMGGKEQQYINKAFETNWIAPLGPNVTGFEKDLESYLGMNSHATALSSGTAAIHIALILLGIGPNDEVICQSKTFAASANPITYLGAKPVFVDSETETWNISPELLEKAIKDRIAKNKKPKAIITVHLYGMPYLVADIHKIASDYEIPIIEDSAEALGSSFSNQKCGTFGFISVLSFNGNKIITTSGGGAIITKDKSLNERALFLATQARDNAAEYHHSTIGYNYRMSNVLAGIGRGQMKVLDERVQQRRSNYQTYHDQLNFIDKIAFLNEPPNYKSNRWLTCFLLDSEKTREGLRIYLEKLNIESRPLWKPMHLQPIYKNSPAYTNGVSSDLFKRGLCIPSGSNLTEDEINRVILAIKMYFRV